MGKFIRYYLMPEVWSTVTDSQVFGWVKLINEKGYTTHCISIVDFRKFWKNRDLDNQKIARQIGGRFLQIPIIEKASLFIDIQVFILLLLIWAKEVLFVDKLVFQSRMSWISYALSWIRHFPKVRVIFDSRGAEFEELRYGDGEADPSWKTKIRLKSALLHERKAVIRADRVFVVSEALKEYHVRNNSNVSEGLITVVPGCADHHAFYFDESLRSNGRIDLGLKDETVLVYSGALQVRWAVPEKLFQLFRTVRRFNENTVLLLLTPDTDIAIGLRTTFAFSETDVIVKQVRYSDVNKYLNASDIGVLLREKHPTNSNAAPTKFAEYILCGLPVIISSSITGYAEFVQTYDVGYVLESFDELSLSREPDPHLRDFVASKGRLSNASRSAIRGKGISHLSKQALLPRILEVLDTL